MQHTLQDAIASFDAASSDTSRHALLKKMGLLDIQDHLAFSETHYQRNVLCRRDDYELVAIGWSRGQFTPIHGHGVSSCAIHVLQGELLETHFEAIELNGQAAYAERQCAVLRSFDQSYISGETPLHQIRCLSERAVSLHLYSPPLNIPGSGK